MEWLGFITLIMVYGCFFVACVSSIWSWVGICFWMIPVFAMSIQYKTGMEINGLMVLISLCMFAICRKTLVGVSLWNTKQRKIKHLVFGTLYCIVFLSMFYSFSQAQLQGYMLNIQGWGQKDIRVVPMLIITLVMIALTWPFTTIVYTAIDGIYTKKENVVLLSCQFYIANEKGAENSLLKGYFVEGVQNGITYYFRMTKRTYYMLQKQTHLKIVLKKGILGGHYVRQFEKESHIPIVKKMDQISVRIGIMGLAFISSLGIWFFWYR